MRCYLSLLMAELLVVSTVVSPFAAQAQTITAPGTTTPIKHIVVIFNENISFDHYFGTYPVATNPQGEPVFKALPDTPAVNGLSGGLLTNNPNLNPANATGAVNPFRLDRSQAATAVTRITITGPSRLHFTTDWWISVSFEHGCRGHGAASQCR